MKTIFEKIISLIVLLLLSPIYIVLAVLVYFSFGHPIFFSQIRPGINNIPFKLYKFRTMLNTKDKNGNLLPNNERMTNFGNFLRSHSLDELPELFNILKGDMSFVGPRPLLMEYLPLYSERQKKRHNVKPGLTGWAQINGRNAITWEEKFELDIWYVENQSFWLDIKIIFLTIIKVLKQEGITHPGDVAMPRFLGSKGKL
jgi:sugar transferase EpsL